MQGASRASTGRFGSELVGASGACWASLGACAVLTN
jgi:membrane associated rhomboid family serine protease